MPNLLGEFSPVLRLSRLKQFLERDDQLAGEVLANSHYLRQHTINKIKGLHPGDQGIATPTIRSMTHFGSGLDIGKLLYDVLPAFKGARNEIFVGANHGIALKKALQAGESILSKEQFGFRLSDKSFVTREEAKEKFGFRSSEELHMMRIRLGSHDTYNAIEDLRHGGMAEGVRHKLTDFGSPLDIGKALLRAAGLMEEQAPKAIEYITHIDSERYEMPGFMKKRIQKRVSEQLRERPTAGLVNHVLGDPLYHHGHAKFMGKSY